MALSSEQLASALELKIKESEVLLEALTSEFDQSVAHLDIAETNTKIIRIARMMTRRRTLIEVWEVATGRSWGVDPVASVA